MHKVDFPGLDSKGLSRTAAVHAEKADGARRGPYARILLGDDSHSVEKELHGRIAWTLAKLAHAGERGISSLEVNGPRLSHYIWVLRHREGVAIESVDERHGGSFAGSHSRYKLRSKVKILEQRGVSE
jgi:hypothetical protein